MKKCFHCGGSGTQLVTMYTYHGPGTDGKFNDNGDYGCSACKDTGYVDNYESRHQFLMALKNGIRIPPAYYNGDKIDGKRGKRRIRAAYRVFVLDEPYFNYQMDLMN